MCKTVFLPFPGLSRLMREHVPAFPFSSLLYRGFASRVKNRSRKEEIIPAAHTQKGGGQNMAAAQFTAD